jgi:hypothetical protein
MTVPPLFHAFFALLLGASLALGAPARAAGTVAQAFQTARTAVSPQIQTKVVSLYGLGTPAAISKWYIIFYDPSIASHGRAVLVENNQITKTYEARGGTTYAADLTFDPTRITDEQPALLAAQTYAAKHAIAYDSVRALLKQTKLTKPFRWRIELMKGVHSRGYVLVSALDDSVASYVPPSGEEKKSSHSVAADAEGFAQDVKTTFLGIGGDLEEFFTGERTVDK